MSGKAPAEICRLFCVMLTLPEILTHKTLYLWLSPGIEPASYTFPWVLVWCWCYWRVRSCACLSQRTGEKRGLAGKWGIGWG